MTPWLYSFLFANIYVVVMQILCHYHRKWRLKRKYDYMPPTTTPKDPKPKPRFKYYANGGKKAEALGKTLSEKFLPLFDKVFHFDSMSMEMTFNCKDKDKKTKMLLDVGFTARMGDKKMATFSLRSLPGCASIIISHNTWIDETLRGKGISKVMMQMKHDIVQAWGSSKILATVVAGNKIEQEILRKEGWKMVETFNNSQTGNKVEMWSKDIEVIASPNIPVSETGTKDAPDGSKAIAPNDANTPGKPE